MAQLSSKITGKIRSCVFLLSALTEQGPKVVDLVLKKLGASVEEGTEPSELLAQILTMGRLLKTRLDLMVELDRKLYEQNQMRADLLAGRDGNTGALSKKVSGVRRIIAGHYAKPQMAKLGLEGRTLREPIALLRQSELICEGFKRDDLGDLLGESIFDLPFDPRPYALEIEPGIEVLRESFEAHQRSRRRIDQLLVEKNETVEIYDTAFIRVARQFEDLCRLAGQNDLAEKVRPSASRPGETDVLPEDGEVPEIAAGVVNDDAGAPEPSPADGEPDPAAPAA